MNSLFWHDYETWGESPTQDKPSQFAGVRTDEALNVIGEPLSIYCQPASDCLPKPIACLITGITPQLAKTKGLPDNQFFAAIHRELSQPGTCGVGYNSIRFDDEVTRNGLFRNFYDPYEREWKNNNARWDIIDVVRMTYALRPEGIHWPKREDCMPSFKLENLTAANGLAHAAAHDALSDVYASIALAKLIKTQQPNLYDYAYRLRFKKEVANLVDLRQQKPLLHISSKYPASHACAALVVPLIMHPTNQNGLVVFDLAADPQMLMDLTADEIRTRLFTRREDLEEGAERVPLKVVHFNKSPMLVTAKLVDSKAEERMQLDKALCDKHWQQLRKLNVAEKIREVFLKTTLAEPPDVEQQLYGSFIHDNDKPTLKAVRHADAATLASTQYAFYDKRLPELLFRYKARNFPETLTEDEQLQWEEFRLERFTNPEAGAGITLEEFYKELEKLRSDPSLTAEKHQILQDLQLYADDLVKELPL